MKITYDKSADAAYISLKDASESKVISTDSFEVKGTIPFGEINIDFDQNNKIVAFEFLNASKYLSQEILEK